MTGVNVKCFEAGQMVALWAWLMLYSVYSQMSRLNFQCDHAQILKYPGMEIAHATHWKAAIIMSVIHTQK